MTDYVYTTGYPMTVYRGALLLDELRPGWEDGIDVRALDMADVCRCIVGQLYGDYDLTRLGIGGVGAEYGFSVWGRQRWDDLTMWWRELIAERRAQHDQGD